MYFCVNEFEFDVNDGMISCNEQQKVYVRKILKSLLFKLINEN